MPFIERKSSGGGAFFKWDAVGKEFTGKYVRLGQGEYKGKPTYYGVFVQEGTGAEVKVTAPAVLARRLREEFQPGARLFIKRVEDLPSQPGQNAAKNFFIAEWEDVAGGLPSNQPPATPQALPVIPPPPAPATPAANLSEYDRLLNALGEKVGQSNLPLMKKMLDAYPGEAAKLEALKQTLRTNYGMQV